MLASSAAIPRNQDLQAAGRVWTCKGYPWLETPMLSLPVKTILTASRTMGGAGRALQQFTTAMREGSTTASCRGVQYAV